MQTTVPESRPASLARRKTAIARSPLGGLALALLCLAVYLPGIASTPPVDRDEPRFALASRQMYESVALPDTQLDPHLHSGGLVIPRVGGEVGGRERLNKPPVIYWAQAASAAIFSKGDPFQDALWMYRLPSVLSAICAVLITWRIGLSLFDPRCAWLAGALLALCPLVWFDAHLARADQLLLAVTTGAMWAQLTIWRRARRKERVPIWLSVTFWALVSLGVMVKGPVTPIVTGATALGLGLITGTWKQRSATRPWLAPPILLLFIAPWVLAVFDKVGLANYLDIVFGETVGRSTSGAEGHWGPPGYHLVLLIATFWPGSLLVAFSVVNAAKRAIKLGGSGSLLTRWKQRTIGRDAEVFLLAWIIPAWLVFELVSTKLPHYVLPMFPALALLTARAMIGVAAEKNLTPRVWAKAGFVLWSLIALGGAAAVYIAADRIMPTGATPTIIAFCILAIVGAVLGLRWAFKQRPVHAFWSGAVVSAALSWTVFGLVLPHVTDLSPRIAAELERLGWPERPVATAGYQEDSLIYLLRGRVDRITDGEAAQWLADHPDGLLVDKEPTAAGGRLITELSGIKLGNAKVADVGIREPSDD